MGEKRETVTTTVCVRHPHGEAGNIRICATRPDYRDVHADSDRGYSWTTMDVHGPRVRTVVAICSKCDGPMCDVEGDAVCQDCGYSERIETAAPKPADVWVCTACGEVHDPQTIDKTARWHWTGIAWEHKCEGINPQAGHMYAIKARIPVRRSEKAAEIAEELNQWADRLSALAKPNSLGYAVIDPHSLRKFAARVEALCEPEPSKAYENGYNNGQRRWIRLGGLGIGKTQRTEAVRVANRILADDEDDEHDHALVLLGGYVSWGELRILARAVLKGETDVVDDNGGVCVHSDRGGAGGVGCVDTVVSGCATPVQEVAPTAPAIVYMYSGLIAIMLRALRETGLNYPDDWVPCLFAKQAGAYVPVPVHGAPGGECEPDPHTEIGVYTQAEWEALEARAEKAEQERDEAIARAKIAEDKEATLSAILLRRLLREHY